MLDMNNRLHMHHKIVFRFPTIFVTGSLDDGLASIEVKVLIMIGVKVGASLARACAVFPTGTEARAQTEVVDAESDGREEDAEKSRYGPFDGVVVQGGLNHFLLGGEQLASLEPVDRIVPKQTEGFVQEGQVHFDDVQLLDVKIDGMRIDIQILLLFGIEDVVLE